MTIYLETNIKYQIKELQAQLAARNKSLSHHQLVVREAELNINQCESRMKMLKTKIARLHNFQKTSADRQLWITAKQHTKFYNALSTSIEEQKNIGIAKQYYQDQIKKSGKQACVDHAHITGIKRGIFYLKKELYRYQREPTPTDIE
ncbi:hypothetical protein PHYBLDRAFT_150759 [Phycomyces blakesleeanus NRRL 1555(-)]|uniref:Uncharacterized protein n=1 Tax=Phycomyces blakesleeanus (strain ATCC 8743b / DSM 1359 / FGSC 10004 / NBRC 33097 / NRRL 1555) TaxID=763407 RepID=A0A167KH67_PHYB8|nr:hypothetical protein PHYBLDRAFT_150759 [Phycomyces blakesleeanus NRRL 1555(-)]OAD68089.1 hypothetical protein PHYBLDRAFT_150759 [Phycomyces blakesleeanus NRRL 1555(-)]|eukprot:XP_018286129.1 hypothetical protein PHYBLDRAFT_150759 [Phycomyces blakesleeanus NRRL 1555(-)]